MPINSDLKKRIETAISGGKLDGLLRGMYSLALVRDGKPIPGKSDLCDGMTILGIDAIFNAEGTSSREYAELEELSPGIYSGKCNYVTLLDLVEDPGLTHFHHKRIHTLHEKESPNL